MTDAANPTLCEIEGCGMPAILMVRDFEQVEADEGGYWVLRPIGQWHHFCETHQRESRTYRWPTLYRWPEEKG